MDFALSATATKLRDELLAFMDQRVYPAEAVYRQQMMDLDNPHGHPQVLEDLKADARDRGLWNLFFPGTLSNVDYAPLAEIMGRSLLAPEACNCAAPDTGNMEILALFGSGEQKERWLRPLLDGAIRSAFAMTEPGVASSDATNIACRIDPVRDRGRDEYLINGRKWWISGAASPRCAVFIVMGKTDPTAPPYRRQSMILVPVDTPGVTVVRNLPVFGYADREGHCEVLFEDVRVPAGNMLGQEGGGFAIAQARLGPGRVHHCMRTIGVAERALELMCQRVQQRHAFGKPLADQGVIQGWIADARIEIDQARLYTLYAAWLMDTEGNQAARTVVSGIKVAVPLMALRVIDHAIQAHGAAGIGDDFPLASMFAHVRTLRLADGPDEVHRGVVARHELRKWAR